MKSVLSEIITRYLLVIILVLSTTVVVTAFEKLNPGTFGMDEIFETSVNQVRE